MREVVKAFKALSDETRLRILKLLLQRECCVCKVMQALDISQTRASRNLNALYDAGFLKLRKDGLWSFYSIDEDHVQGYMAELVEAVENGADHDANPVKFKLPYTGNEIDIGFFSRNRKPHSTSMCVTG